VGLCSLDGQVGHDMSAEEAEAVDVSEPEVTEAQFSRWKLELENKIAAEEEKRQAKERQAFKAHEDARFWGYKQGLHDHTMKEFRGAKEEVEAMRQQNLDAAGRYKEELVKMKERMKQTNEDWMHFGHELTLEHGAEQMHRTKESMEESKQEKAALGKAVRKEEQKWTRELDAQRSDWVDTARERVANQKDSVLGNAEASILFALRQRQEKVRKVKRDEHHWKQQATDNREQHIEHALDNKKDAMTTNEQMRSARKDLVKTHLSTAREERSRKEKDADNISKEREKVEREKQLIHDKVVTERRASPEKVRVMKQVSRAKSPKKAAIKTGLVTSPNSQRSPSPYKLKR